ncbi:hypothetical protein LPJ66_010293, partial [Kickxella alabastrina]
MEFVHQHLLQIVKDMYQNAQPQRPELRSTSAAAGFSEWSVAGLEDVYILLGQAHTQSAMQLVDRGVTCLVSDMRSLFRVCRSESSEQDTCFCILPGRFCSVCSTSEAQGFGGSGCYQM